MLDPFIFILEDDSPCRSHPFQILPRHAERVAFSVEEAFDRFGGAGAVVRVEFRVPLVQPRLQFEEADEEEGELRGGEP